MRDCRLYGMPDLNYTSVNVQNKVKEFLNKLISFGVSGFRVQGCLYMWPKDLRKIFTEVNNLNTNFGFSAGSRPYFMCEAKDTGKEGASE
jgi:alpha-amylase